MTEQRIQEISAMLEGITQGPWEQAKIDWSLIMAPEGKLAGDCLAEVYPSRFVKRETAEANAAFIAAAPGIVRELLAALEAAEASVKERITNFEQYQNDVSDFLRTHKPMTDKEYTSLNCPTCGGSGHIDDAKSKLDEVAALKERAEAQQTVIEALARKADFAEQAASLALNSSWKNEQYRGICQTLETARASLREIEGGVDNGY